MEISIARFEAESCNRGDFKVKVRQVGEICIVVVAMLFSWCLFLFLSEACDFPINPMDYALMEGVCAATFLLFPLVAVLDAVRRSMINYIQVDENGIVFVENKRKLYLEWEKNRVIVSEVNVFRIRRLVFTAVDNAGGAIIRSHRYSAKLVKYLQSINRFN